MNSNPHDKPVDNSLGRWFVRNGPLLVVLALVVVLANRWLDIDLVTAGKVVLGLGMVIFVHELGHFLVAKWCDVHVETFSLGFGPALPGCSFKWGEATYMIGLIPLGGYVKMVGEGPENDENADDPRSFKNKTVGQRMAIISAGVTMNLIMALACFVAVFMAHGADRTPAVAQYIEAGSPAWTKGIKSGDVIHQIGEKGPEPRPYFEDLRTEVMLSAHGQKLPFIFGPPGAKENQLVHTDVEPRLTERDTRPLIGVAPPSETKLLAGREKKHRQFPVRYNSAAASARQLELQAGDRVLATTDPYDPAHMKDLPPAPPGQLYDSLELCNRLRALSAAGKPMTVQVLRGAEKIEVTTGEGFHFDDQIIGITHSPLTTHHSPLTNYDPYHVTELPSDPRNSQEKKPDFFEFDRRMKILAGKPVVVQVHRKHESRPINILVPPAYHYTFGMRMRMGKIAAVREGSPAAKAGVQADDILKHVEINADGEVTKIKTEDADPMRLPFELEQLANGKNKVTVTLTVLRPNPKTKVETDPVKLPPVQWEEQWRFDDELPLYPSSPLAIKELGLAYRVEATIAEVTKGSSADKAGLQKDDEIEEVRTKYVDKKESDGKWGKWVQLKTKRGDEEVIEPWWASLFWSIQGNDYAEIEIKVKRPGEGTGEPIQLQAREDLSWPLADRGWIFIQDARLQKAQNFGEALSMGVTETYGFIQQIYLTLRSLASRRLSPENLGGPIMIAQAAYHIAGISMFHFLIFLGIISVNLAVINFLPIPVLDGGHMVFLIYEKIRGKPASEQVRLAATYVGLAVILCLVVFVFYQDIKRSWFS